MASEQELSDAYKLLRSFLRKNIKGKNTDAILNAMAVGGADYLHNAKAVNDNLFIVSAEGRYLDRILADRNFVRPGQVGLSDEDFRTLGVEVTTRKQVRDLIMSILETIYGYEYTRAYAKTTELEPYNLTDGDLLTIQFDDGEVISIRFDVSQFENIAAATAREVSDVITRTLRAKGKGGFADVGNDGLGNYIILVSPTIGPSSTVKVVGGRSQNVLKFPTIRPTSQDVGTQLTLSAGSGGVVRAVWTGGPSPSFGKVKKGDYVNVFGTIFDVENRGSFTVTDSGGGSLGVAFVEWVNPIGVSEVAAIGSSLDITFFEPTRNTLISKPTFAAAYQVEDQVLEVYLPALTRIVRRDRLDAAYLVETEEPLAQEQVGNFLYDLDRGFVTGSITTNTSSLIDPNLNGLVSVANANQFPDEAGYLIFGLGTARQEGPVPYVGRPSSNTLRISPVYQFTFNHAVGTDITIVTNNAPVVLNPSGTDYQTYVTDMSSGRLFAEELIDAVVATGIRLVIYIMYPGNEGLSSWNRPGPEAADQWHKVFD